MTQRLILESRGRFTNKPLINEEIFEYLKTLAFHSGGNIHLRWYNGSIDIKNTIFVIYKNKNSTWMLYSDKYGEHKILRKVPAEEQDEQDAHVKEIIKMINMLLHPGYAELERMKTILDSKLDHITNMIQWMPLGENYETIKGEFESLKELVSKE